MSSLIPPVYRAPFGLPLHWGDEVSGELRAAVMAYLQTHAPDERQMKMLKDYLVHFINAPCWSASFHQEQYGSVADDYELAIAGLIGEAQRITSAGDIEVFISHAMEWGLDPF